ncbi:class I SAM-dependent methyltransferase [Kitasatospora sp. NPDC058965]|uniref:class I SAM-dependent methyltransferase n=1 Tax=Kitasatospora sp. NPDC058965 TaxID=3346682 RepID=UPI00369FE71C
MTEIVNTVQSEAWNGAEGRHWSEHQDRWNAVNQGFNAPLLAAAGIGPADRVLDIGCGAGQTTRLAARAAHRGSALGLDLSGPMLAAARQAAAAEGLANVDFVQGDAQVHPLPDGGFDAAISRFGIMFFADPVAAFGNVGRALRPGGRLAFVCMAEPASSEWVRLYAEVSAALAVAPQQAGVVDGPGMFSLADPAVIRQTLGAAGFERIEVESAVAPATFGHDAEQAADLLLGSGPGQHLLGLVGDERAVRAAFTTALAAYARPDGVHLRTGAWLVRALRA